MTKADMQMKFYCKQKSETQNNLQNLSQNLFKTSTISFVTPIRPSIDTFLGTSEQLHKNVQSLFNISLHYEQKYF